MNLRDANFEVERLENKLNKLLSDKELLETLKKEHNLIITLEDGILDGGFGQKIASFYGDSNIKVKNYGLKKKFYDRYNPEELLVEEKMDTESILDYIKSIEN